MEKILIAIALILISTTAHAGTAKTASDTIKSFRVGSSGTVASVYKNVRNTLNPAGCVRDYPLQLSQVSGNGVVEKSYDQMLASIMAAKISNGSVIFYIYDDRCSGNYPSIAYIEVE